MAPGPLKDTTMNSTSETPKSKKNLNTSQFYADLLSKTKKTQKAKADDDSSTKKE